MEVEFLKDYSELIHLIHHVAVNGQIIWPEFRKGEKIDGLRAEKN